MRWGLCWAMVSSTGTRTVYRQTTAPTPMEALTAPLPNSARISGLNGRRGLVIYGFFRDVLKGDVCLLECLNVFVGHSHDVPWKPNAGYLNPTEGANSFFPVFFIGNPDQMNGTHDHFLRRLRH